jgi:hypothetical protein
MAIQFKLAKSHPERNFRAQQGAVPMIDDLNRVLRQIEGSQ